MLNLMRSVLVFDLGGVLMMHNIPRCIENFKRILGDNFSNLGLGTDGEGKADALMDKYEKGLVSTESFLKTILDWCIPGTTQDDVKDAWISMHAGIPADRIEGLKDLKRAGYTMYLLSNNNELHWSDVLSRVPGFEDLFKDVFMSFREHVSKPDPRLFRIVMERTGAAPEEILFVDDLEANRLAAEKLGWHSVPSLEELCASRVHHLY